MNHSPRPLACLAVADPRPAQHPAEAELEDDLQRLEGLGQVDLGVAGAAVLEQDRRLAHPTADLTAPEQDLLHERVAAGTDPAEVDLGQLGAPVAPERAAIVAGLQSQEQPGVE